MTALDLKWASFCAGPVITGHVSSAFNSAIDRWRLITVLEFVYTKALTLVFMDTSNRHFCAFNICLKLSKSELKCGKVG
jgi:hypothetical protein